MTAFQTVSSSVTMSKPATDEILHIARKYKHIVVWAQSGVAVLTGENLKENHLERLIEIRAFCMTGEFKAVNINGSIIARTRTDGSGAPVEYLDETHKLWGEPQGVFKDGYTTLTEDRGTLVKVPFEVAQGKKVFVTVRNYLGDKDFEFTDWRFVEFSQKEAKEYD